MTTYTNYANFNTAVFQGRVSNCEIKSGAKGDFLSLTVISTLKKDGDEVSVVLTDSDQLMNFADLGYLVKGQQVTLTGRIGAISEVYTDKNGDYQMRQRPQITLQGASIPVGGLGAKPAADKAAVTPANAGKRIARRPQQEVAVDATPEVAPF